MSRYYGGWAPYVPVSERRRQAERAVARLRKSGHPVAPVTLSGRLIATTFWGRAWCDNIESYRDYETRLPRGRSYLRNGSVVDLQMSAGRITALVSGSELYDVAITIKETAKSHWRAICADCAGGIDSLVELLQGRFSKGVMERLCRQEGGLFPRPSDIRFSCSCPDFASMCKHVAAVLYGVGTRLDQQPDLLFRLRAVDEAELLAETGTVSSLSKTGPAAGGVLQTDDMAALFGLEMATEEEPATGEASNGPGPRLSPPARKRTDPAATAAVARISAPQRASAGAPPAKPAPTGKAQVAKKVSAKPVAAEPQTARATACRPPAPKQIAPAEASPRLAVPETSLAIGNAEATRRKPTKTQQRADAPSRPMATSAAAPKALEMPTQRRPARSATKDKTATGLKPRQKPVKWW